jgi:hypothetical protein
MAKSSARPEERDDHLFMARRFWLNKESHPISARAIRIASNENNRPGGPVEPAAYNGPAKNEQNAFGGRAFVSKLRVNRRPRRLL